MRVNGLPTFNQTITILYRLCGADSAYKKDEWRKKVIGHCSWSSLVTRSQNGTDVKHGASYVARIPMQPDYKEYSHWAKTPDDGFTVSRGDIVILGEIDETPTAENVMQIMRDYKPNAFMVSTFKDNTKAINLLQHYRIEGV